MCLLFFSIIATTSLLKSLEIMLPPPPLHCRTLRRTPVLKGPAVTVGPSVEAPTNCRLR